MTNNKIIVGLVVLALILGGYAAIRPAQVKIVTRELAGLAGPDVPSPYLKWGGVAEWRSGASLRTGTTTVCSLVSPAATSTLKYASLRIDTGSTTALAVDFTKGTAVGATGSSTDRFNSANLVLAANASNVFVASSTGLGAALDTFNPSTNLNIILNNGSGAGQLAPTGYCQAAWTQI